MLEQRYSDNDMSNRDIPSFIEPRPPLIQNPFMRPRPQKGTNLLELFEEDSEIDEPELVQVYLRLKPCKVPNTLYEVRSDRCLVTSLDTTTAGHGRRTQHNVAKMYTFSKIFSAECNQKEIFESVVKDNLRKLPDGQNFTLLTYGASGSGKTYTLMGTVSAPGLVPRSLEYVFRLVDAAQQPAFRPAENGAERLEYAEQDYELQWVKHLRHVSAPLRDKYRRMSVQLHSDLTLSSIDLSNRIRHYVWVSFVEIYNEAVYDLLAPPQKRTKLRIREDSSGNVYVKGATQAFVRSGEEAYDVMVAGKHNRMVAATGVHSQSSRSHCIFTITMLTETADGSVRTSYVRLCDLAGCERARATRNTGARMVESRAINSSLHVLERCLHMLRRKQKTKNDAMVPYRESKLTRLLGTGLSGARGEAVSMVVTLNTSSEYAHETKHVLALAAVAQDIQINNTMMYASTLESSAQETTISCSTEVMKLRADNERLHFELVQAQARIKELTASMDEKQQESANTMRELVEEAKDLTKQYYETQLEALRCEMEDMAEEYESRLAEVSAPTAGSPSRLPQAKDVQLMTEIALLEEKLTAERLARSRAEKELEHLRTCIEERDEKAFKDSPPPSVVFSLSESEHESDDETNDPYNESLEPMFMKDLNRSLAIQNEKCDTTSVHTIRNIDEECDSDLEKSHDTTNNDDNSKNSTYAIGEDDDDDDYSKKSDVIIDNINDTNSMDFNVKTYTNKIYDNEKICDKYDESLKNDANKTYDNQITNYTCDDSLNNDDNRNNDNVNDLSVDYDTQFKNKSIITKSGLRGTYFISDCKISDKNDYIEDPKEKKTHSFRGTYFVKDPLTDVSKSSEPDEKESIPEVFKEPVIRENSKINIKVSELPAIKIVREKSNVDMKGPEKSSENQYGKVVREKSNIDMKSTDKSSESRYGKIMRDTSNVDIKAPEKSSERQYDKIIREKSNVDIKVPEKSSESQYGKVIREKSKVDIKPTEKSSENQYRKIVREKSNVDMKASEKSSESQFGKIIREKSNVDMKATEKSSESQYGKVIRDKSKVDIKPTEKSSENQYRKIVREKSNVDMKASEKSSESQFGKIIREKSNDDMKATEKSSESQYGKIIREKSTVDIKPTERSSESQYGKIITEKSNVDIKLTEKSLESRSGKIVREKSNVDMKMSEKQTENEERKIIRGKTNIGMKVPDKVNIVNKMIRAKTNVDMKTPQKLSEALVNKIIRSFKSNQGSDCSLRQFEQLEKASNECNNDTRNVSVFGDIKILKEKRTYFDNESGNNNVPKKVRTYFDNIDDNVEVANKRMNDLMNLDDERSPSIVKDVVSENFEPSTIKKLLGESFTKPDVVISAMHETRVTKKHDSLDIFDGYDSPLASKTKEIVDNIEIARKSIEKLVLDQKSAKKNAKADIESRLFIREDINPSEEVQLVNIKKEIKLEPQSSVEETNETASQIEKETKLEPVSSIDEPNQTNDKENNTIEEFENIYKDITAPRATEFDLLIMQEFNERTEKNDNKEIKYNLRKKNDKTKNEEILAESEAKCESKVRKRPLRLRRRKNQEEDNLKDIVNLQSEFSDVTLDLPAPKRNVKDIPSPEKGAEENLPPLMGIQSCPSKSVTRSRRKLFTPRAEPLEESLTQTGDSNERIYVPRPSYHRPRARRKL